MEYCDGGDLTKKIEEFKNAKKPIENFGKLVVILMAQLGAALDHCHNLGRKRILHKDVKPDNIFLMADGVTCKALVFVSQL